MGRRARPRLAPRGEAGAGAAAGLTGGQLTVPMVDVVLVTVPQRREDVHEIAPRLILRQPAALCNAIEELAALRRRQRATGQGAARAAAAGVWPPSRDA